MLSVEFADGFAINLGFRQIANYEIEAIEIVSTKRLVSFTRHDNLVTKLAECMFEQNTQLIVVIHDENPAFFHQAPISERMFEERYRALLYENLPLRVRNISRTCLRIKRICRMLAILLIM
jgi:hypothetical protein